MYLSFSGIKIIIINWQINDGWIGYKTTQIIKTNDIYSWYVWRIYFVDYREAKYGTVCWLIGQGVRNGEGESMFSIDDT